MFRSHWRIIVTIVGGLAIAGVIGWRLQPQIPNIRDDSSFHTIASDYKAYHPECKPSALAKLVPRERAGKAVACADSAEQHYEAANTLVEARRQADAANAATILTYEQTGIAAWGAVFGFLTLIAAGVAAFYAKRAAEYTEKANQIAAAPFVTIELLDAEKIMYDPATGRIGTRKDGVGEIKRSPRILCRLRSTGSTPVIVTGLYQHWEPSESYPRAVDPFSLNGKKAELNVNLVVGPDGVLVLSWAEIKQVGQPKDRIHFHGYIRYTDMQGENTYVSGYYFELVDRGMPGMVAALPENNSAAYWYRRKV